MRAFRHTPPEADPTAVLRPRLLRAMLARFEVPVVTVVAPPGYGKSTLLVQAMSENALAPRGWDVWLACEPADADAAHLERSLRERLGLAARIDAGAHGPAQVADALCQRAPLEVILVLDDVHEVAPGSSGASFLDELVTALPANGHLVLAGRAAPPLPLARLAAQGRVARIGPHDLLLTAGEQIELAGLLRTDPGLLAGTGGWPALARLTATAGRAGADRFVWEEVLDHMSPAARRTVAHLVAVGGADDEVAAAVLGGPVDLTAELAGVPLIGSRDGPKGSWWVPHALWHPMIAADLSPVDAATARRRAGAVMRGRGDLRRAGELIFADPVTDDGWPEVADLLVAGASLLPTLTHRGAVAGWLAAVPADRREEPEALLLAGALARSRGRVDEAAPRLRRAWNAARAAGRVGAEVAAMTQLSHLAWWQGDLLLVSPPPRELVLSPENEEIYLKQQEAAAAAQAEQERIDQMSDEEREAYEAEERARMDAEIDAQFGDR